MQYLLAAIFGLVVGSFLNVCIYRIPRDGSVAKPSRSYCPHCNHTLSALDNIPVLSYIYLKGKCRYCKEPISPRYMTVELLTAILFVLMIHRSLPLHLSFWQTVLELFTTCVFISMLIVISFIDLEFTIIPNKVVFVGLPIGLLFAIIASLLNWNIQPLLSRVLGAAVGAGIIVLIAIGGKALFRKEAMGGGDIKLMAMIGIYLGFWPHIPLTIMIAAFLGSLIGVIVLLFRKNKQDSTIPFGPFLSIGALISLMYGTQIWLWYKRFMGF